MRTQALVPALAGVLALISCSAGCSQARQPASASAVAAVTAPPVSTALLGDTLSPVVAALLGLSPDIGYAPVKDSDGLKRAWDQSRLPLPKGAPDLPAGGEGATVEIAAGDLHTNVLVLMAPDAAALEPIYRSVAPEGAAGECFSQLAEGPPLSGALVRSSGGFGLLLLAGGTDAWSGNEAVARMRRTVPVALPASLGEWSLTEPVTYDTKTIYDYIDGAADKPMRYGLEGMVGGRYVRGTDKVIVDVYRFRSGPDAFGYFSVQAKGKPTDLPVQLALDNGRTLHLWHGCTYVEVKAGVRGVDLSAPMREIAAALGPVLGPEGSRPKLVEKLEGLAGDVTRLHWFHESYEQMNYVYLSTSNVLHLGPGTDGLIVVLGDPPRKEIVLAVRYAASEEWEAALTDARAVIEKPGKPLTPDEPYEWDPGKFAYIPAQEKLPPRTLVGVFDAPTPERARQLAEEVLGCLR